MDLSPASRLWDYRILKHLDEHVRVVYEGTMKIMDADNVVDVAVIHHPHHDVLEVVVSDPTFHVEVPRMYLRAEEILNGMPKDEFEKQFEEKKDFFRKRHRHYDSHTIERNIRYQHVHNFLQARIHMVYETDFAIDNTKIMVYLQAVNLNETVVDVIFDTADILPGQMTSGRRLLALCRKPDLLIPINTKFGEEEHSFVLFQYFERVRVIRQHVVTAFLDNINARIRRYQSEQLALKVLIESQINKKTQQSDATSSNRVNGENYDTGLASDTMVNKQTISVPSPSSTPIIGDDNESAKSNNNVYTGPYSKARCRWIYVIHHTIFRNMVAKARARLDIVSMSRKSPDKILLMDAKRKEAEEVYAALKREVDVQAAVISTERRHHRTVMDGIKEAMSNLSRLLTHQYTYSNVSPHSPKYSQNDSKANSPMHGSNGMLSRGNSMPLPQSRLHSRPTSPFTSSLPGWNSTTTASKPAYPLSQHETASFENGKENHNLEAVLHDTEHVQLPAVISVGKFVRQHSSPLLAIQHTAASSVISPRAGDNEISPTLSPQQQGNHKQAVLSPRSSRPSFTSAITVDSTSNTGTSSNTSMSSRAQAAMMETKQKLGQFQIFRSAKDGTVCNKSIHPQKNKSSNNSGSSSTPSLPNILTKQKSSHRMRLEEDNNRSISIGLKTSENSVSAHNAE